MAFYPWMRADYTVWTPLPPDVVLTRLDRSRVDSTFSGTVGEDRFELVYRKPRGRNSWRPTMYGTIRRAGTGTLVEVELRISSFVLAFTFMHAVLLPGIAWVLGVVAFTAAANPAMKALYDLVEGRADDAESLAAVQPLGEPHLPGAEADAPWSLRADADLDRVQFTLRGRGWNPFGWKRAVLEVARTRVTVHGLGAQPLSLRRHELVGCSTRSGRRGPQLVLETLTGEVVIPAEAHVLRDVRWLAAYIDVRAGLSGEPLAGERLHREASALLDHVRGEYTEH